VSPTRVTALVPARDEALVVGRAVTALRSIEGITEVVVVDDGSRDETAGVAGETGARVLRSPNNRGKGRALEGALARLEPADVYLLIDADVGETASEAARLLEPVLAGELDLAIGALPPLPGGLGTVRAMSAWMIEWACAMRMESPLSGQRAVRGDALQACRPLARGFGVETAMTMDALRLGFRVGEVPVPMTHRLTGRDLMGFAHRGRQGWDILWAGLPRVLGLR
jgi:glycosyltransferase involved in cell wall biosynthesis